jgi:signal transduction histidine kinase
LGLLVPYRDLRPGLISVSFAALMLVSFVVNLGIKQGAVTVLRVAVLTYVVAELLRFAAIRNPVNAPGRLALQLFGSGIVVGAAAAALVLVAAESRETAGRLALETGVTIFLITIALGLAGIGTRLVQTTDDQIGSTNQQIAWRIARLSGQHWVTQQGLAMKLHGSVQSTMQASLHRLRLAQSDSQVTAVFADLEASLDQLLAAPHETSPLVDQLQDTVDTWRGIADVQIRAVSADLERVGADSVCSTVVQSIVQDSVSNAVRHGGATEIQVALSCHADSVELTITSDGRLPRGLNRPGFGTAQLEACAVSWQRDLDSSPQRLHAVIPLTTTRIDRSNVDISEVSLA